MADAVVSEDAISATDVPRLDARRTGVLLISVMVVALCGITYELIVATVSSYLLGNSVYQFSLTIGLFMFAMGAGSHLTRHIGSRLVERFVTVEMAVALVGGLSSTILFLVFPYYAFYRPVMYGLVIVIGILVGLEIPLLTRILSHSTGLRQAIANVLSLDYLGALVGAVGFPILLLPSLGLFRASFVIGLLNIGVAALTVWVFRRELAGLWRYVAGCACIAGILATALVLSARITQFAEGQLFADQIIYREQTPYQRIIVTRNEGNNEVRLYLDGHIQFASGDEYRYHESLVHPVMSLPGPRRRVLILGGGDGLAARDVLRYPEVERIDLVDIDPAMTQLCRQLGPIARLNQGSLDNPKVTLHHEDAFNFVLDSQDRYDRVIIDLPDPHNEVLSKLYCVEFYKSLRRILAPGGFFVTQSSSPYRTREAYWSIAETIRAAEVNGLGPMQTLSYNIALSSFGLWGFHLAARQGPVPDEFAIDESQVQFMTPQVLSAARVFAKDMGPLPMPVNSLFEPSLYLRYQRGVLQ
jgi:spermidine synthase